jgi:archaellum biogenesis ATPase FlaH
LIVILDEACATLKHEEHEHVNFLLQVIKPMTETETVVVVVVVVVVNQNSIREEINSRLKSENACYHLVQNFCIPVCCPEI